MQINISQLDVEIKRQLPLSLQLENGIIPIEELPLHIQYLIIENEVNSNINKIYFPKNIIDILFEKSVYNDIKVITSKKEAVIEYIRNYLLTNKGSYPFDPEFGTELKTFLHTKDTALRQILIENELKRILSVIQTSFTINIRIISSRTIPVQLSDHTEYHLEIKFSIDEDIVNFALK